MKSEPPLPVFDISCCNISVIFQTFFGHNDDSTVGLYMKIFKESRLESFMYTPDLCTIIRMDARAMSPLLFHFPFNVFETGRNHFVFEGYNAPTIKVVDNSSCGPKNGQKNQAYERLDPRAVLLVAVLRSLELARALAILHRGPEDLSCIGPVSPSTFLAAISSPPFTQQAVWEKFKYLKPETKVCNTKKITVVDPHT